MTLRVFLGEQELTVVVWLRESPFNYFLTLCGDNGSEVNVIEAGWD